MNRNGIKATKVKDNNAWKKKPTVIYFKATSQQNQIEPQNKKEKYDEREKKII